MINAQVIQETVIVMLIVISMVTVVLILWIYAKSKVWHVYDSYNNIIILYDMHDIVFTLGNHNCADNSSQYLVFSNSFYIERLSLDGTRTRTIHSGLNSAFGIDFNIKFVLILICIVSINKYVTHSKVY